MKKKKTARKRKTAQRCIIITQNRYAENFSKLFRRKGYAVQMLKNEEQLRLAAEQKDFNANVILADRVFGPESLNVISELKEKNPKIDIFVISDYGVPELHSAAKAGLIEFFTGPRPSLNYLWSILQRRKQRKEDLAFQKLPRSFLKVIARAVSRGAEKFVFALSDDQLIEAVALDLWYRPIRHVICVSVQVGCVIGCKFCATGRVNFGRNLTSEEIVGQVEKVLGKSVLGQEVLNKNKPFHVTYMGEGEAMANYDAVVDATRTLRGIFGERITFTISTVGITSGLRKILKEGFGPWVNLQLSLHASSESQRRKLIPFQGGNLEEIILLARKYAEQTGQRVCANYILIRRQNDTLQHAEELAKLLDPKSFYIKLSQLNPIAGVSFKPANKKVRKNFRHFLEKYGYNVKYFVSRGREIGSGCGQMIGAPVLPEEDD